MRNGSWFLKMAAKHGMVYSDFLDTALGRSWKRNRIGNGLYDYPREKADICLDLLEHYINT
jgi:hypothetical protein